MAKKKSTLFINKFQDKNGNDYFIDRETGKRRSQTDYRSQWNGNKGRVSRNVFDESIKQYNAFERQREPYSEKIDIQDIVRNIVTVEQAKDQYKSHTDFLKKVNRGEINEMGERSDFVDGVQTGTTLFYNLPETVKTLSDDVTIKILAPDGKRYKTVSKDVALSMVTDLAQQINIENKGREKGASALPMFGSAFNIENNEFQIDLKNAFGLDDYDTLMSDIQDEFD